MIEYLICLVGSVFTAVVVGQVIWDNHREYQRKRRRETSSADRRH
jgi:hypothetical protein